MSKRVPLPPAQKTTGHWLGKLVGIFAVIAISWIIFIVLAVALYQVSEWGLEAIFG